MLMYNVINNKMTQGMKERNSDYFVILRYSNYAWNDIVFLESGLGVNAYCKL